MEKQIKDYPNYYINKKGEVFSKYYIKSRKEVKVKKLSIVKEKSGYCVVGLQNSKGRKRFYVHRLVCLTFKPNPNNLPFVNHIDGNKENNSVENLEWCTALQNNLHAIKNGLRVGQSGEENSMAKLSNKEAIELIELLKEGWSNNDLGEKFNLHPRYVSLIRHKRRWKKLWDSLEKTNKR